jgi:hypothetical protein
MASTGQELAQAPQLRQLSVITYAILFSSSYNFETTSKHDNIGLGFFQGKDLTPLRNSSNQP